MTQQTSTPGDRTHRKGPNFLLIVILSGVAIVLFLIGAYLVVGHSGAKLLPRVHPKNSEPTSYLARPVSDSVEA